MITHGAANVPEPVNADVVIPALVRAVLRLVEQTFQASGAVVLPSTVSVKVPPSGKSYIHIVDFTRADHIFNEPRFVHADRSGSRGKGDHPGGG